MKTTKEILYDNYDINITNKPIANCPNTKWFSEEEIMNVLNKIVNWDNCSEVNYNPCASEVCATIKKELFGDE